MNTITGRVLQAKDVKVHFPVRGSGGTSLVKAVDGVNLHLSAGQTLAIVGESGCGKSSLAYALMGMAPLTAGQVLLDGKPLASGTRAERLALAQRIALVYQDPVSALNPKMRLAQSIVEPLAIQGWDATRQASRVRELMDLVGLPASYADRTPNALSGGQKQRVVIARALALSPKVLVLDEPVSALDVSIRSQILNLLVSLQQQLGLAYLFISHDLSVVRHIADELLVMYLGTVVEQGAADAVFASPQHPYTQALMSAIPLPDPRAQRQRVKILLQGELPSPLNPPVGCPFVSRCPLKQAQCSTQRPGLQPAASGAQVACFAVPAAHV